MKSLNTILALALLCVALALTGCALQSSGAAGSSGPIALEGVLQAPETVAAGSSVKLSFMLVNRSKTDLYILTWYTPLEGIAGEIFDVSRDGQPVPYEGLLATRAVPTADNYVLLGPGKSATATVDLVTAYDFSKPGAYTIAFRSPRISHVAASVHEMATSMDDLGPVEVTSNEVTVDVEGPDGA